MSTYLHLYLPVEQPACQMENKELDSRLRLFQQANMKGKVVLVRVDHNVVKNGIIKDPYRLKPVEALMEESS